MAQAIPSSKKDPLYDLIGAVGEEQITLQSAVEKLRSYVTSLSANEQTAWRENAVIRARRLMSVSEAFMQELTVLKAGQ